VFKLVPPSTTGGAWTESVLHYFSTSATPADGWGPQSGLLLDNGGDLLGTTYTGGNSNKGRFLGTIFDVRSNGRPGGPDRVLHYFADSPDGANPIDSLLRNGNGFIGVTADGGNADSQGNPCGTVYQAGAPATPGGSWTESVIYAFATTNDGCNPLGGLVRDHNGVLYGTTKFGGVATFAGFGTVYSLTPTGAAGGAWTERLLYEFTDGADGAFPIGRLAIGAGGVLYGTTSSGGGSKRLGTVYSLTPPAVSGGMWTLNVLHTFTGDTSSGNPDDGGSPYAGLTWLNGALYEHRPVLQTAPSITVRSSKLCRSRARRRPLSKTQYH
jgi:hypothetical protein